MRNRGNVLMADNPHSSLAFHGVATLLLQVCLGTAASLFVFYIAPEIDIEVGHRSIAFGVSTLLEPLILVFALCCAIALAIIGWRLWLLYIGPWWRRGADA